MSWAAAAVLCACASAPVSPSDPAPRDADEGAQTTVACPEVEITLVELLEEPSVVTVNFDQAELLSWMKQMSDVLRSSLCEMPPRDVAALINLRVQRSMELQLTGRPDLTMAEMEAIGSELQTLTAPAPTLVDFAFRIRAKVRGGPEGFAEAWTPTLVDPIEARLDEYVGASTKVQVRLLREWAANRTLPIMARMGRTVGSGFLGVQKTLARFEGLTAQKTSALGTLLPRDENYWRGILEMVPGNLMVQLGWIAALVADGRLDRAMKALEMTILFSDTEAGFADAELRNLHRLLAVFFAGLEIRLQDGVAQHDAKKYDQAIRTFEGILADYPASARATYELHLSRFARDETTAEPWSVVAQKIFDRDPLFGAVQRIGTSEEAFQGMRRFQIGALSESKASVPERVMNLAEIALDLEEYAFAAHLFWFGFAYLDPEQQEERLGKFLYCLEKLEVPSIKDSFEGDFTKTFVEIDAALRERMIESPAYRAFEQRKKERKK